MHPIYLYAQNFVNEHLDKIESIIDHPGDVPNLPPDFPNIRHLLAVKPKEDLIVGIVGGGVGGLYAALLLQQCGVRSQILEASGDLGGRLFTHYFPGPPKKDHVYYDVGAMRFPDTPLMKHVFDLFTTIGLDSKLIDYHFSEDDNVMTFNSHRVLKSDEDIERAGTFEVPDIPPSYSWKELISNVRKPFADELVWDFEDPEHKRKVGWKLLMDYDKYSTRGFMTTTNGLPKEPLHAALPYDLGVVDWMETFNTSTNSWDHALSDTVLESLAFSWPEQTPRWQCIDGGSGEITTAMKDFLDKNGTVASSDVVLNSRVRAISSLGRKVQIKAFEGTGIRTRTYDHVITTTTLPCLNAMDLSNAGMTYEQRAAIRQITYGPATKIGVRFKVAWWNDARIMLPLGGLRPMKGGQSTTDGKSRVVVYPSYGPDENHRSPVLIVSYTWTADAQAWGALMGDDEDSKATLKDIIIRDLIYVHKFHNADGRAYRFLESQWEDCHAFSWSRNPYTMGAYAYFGPGQYKTMLQHLTTPAGEANLHIAGEAVSACHAWVAGALDASARAVHHIIGREFGEDSDQYKRLKELHDHPEGLSWHNLVRQLITSQFYAEYAKARA